jgi:hypothetical protein
MISYQSYLDETGHEADPKCEFVGVAGFVGTRDCWRRFKTAWMTVLETFEVKSPFHMVEFAHSNGQFRDWKGDEDRRRNLLGQLLNVVKKSGATPVGTIVSTSDYRSLTPTQQETFRSPFYIAMQSSIRGVVIEGVFGDPLDRVSLTYAQQREFEVGAEQLWDAMKQSTWDHKSRMGRFSIASTSQAVPLQAADIFAYELSKEFESRRKRPDADMRWPLREILSMSSIPLPRIHFFDRKELLRIIKESGFPDQTSAEEVHDSQEQSSMESMVAWMLGRGNWKYSGEI